MDEGVNMIRYRYQHASGLWKCSYKLEGIQRSFEDRWLDQMNQSSVLNRSSYRYMHGMSIELGTRQLSSLPSDLRRLQRVYLYLPAL